MAFSKFVPDNYRLLLATGELNLVTDNMKIALMDNAYIFDPVNHSYWDDISVYEIPHQNGYSDVYSLPLPVLSYGEGLFFNYGGFLIEAIGGGISFNSMVMYDASVVNNPIVAAFLLFSPRVVSSTLAIQNIIIVIK